MVCVASSKCLRVLLVLCLSVCLCSIRNERINLVFGMEAFFHHCVLKKFWHLQNKGTSLCNVFLNPGLRKFRHGVSIVDLSSRKAGCDKLDRCRSNKLTIPPSSDARPLSFIAEIVKLCLQRDFVSLVNRERKCADTIDTVPVPWASHFQC